MTRTLTLAVLALAWIAVDCSAAPPEGKRGKGAGEDGKRAQQRGGDPAQVVARMMQEFDKDGDQKLDAQELTALMTSMRERRGAGASGARPGQSAGKGRQRPGGDSKRKRGADENNKPGGEKPKRPVAE
ncbi:MAG: EF-hand domain-containing protein [Rubripirellula sp.]